jgi:Thermolysin metallopeptidase, catalytic domain/Thermolysin metallopeptidase, alpha-helical domain
MAGRGDRAALGVKEEELRVILLRRLGQVRGIKALRESLSEEDRARFPMATTPRLAVFAWKGSFRLSWTAIAWGQFENLDSDATTIELDVGPAFVDAVTGDVFLHSRSKHSAEVPATGTGTRCTPLSGPFGSRSLKVVRIDTTSTYRLKDITRARTIVTCDAAGNSAFLDDSAVGRAIADGTLPVSEDNDSDAAWTRTPTNKSDAERTASQQPEVDLHWFMGDIYDWYEAIGDRVGWDNDDFDEPPVPKQTLHAIAHQLGSSSRVGYQDFHWKNGSLAATWLAIFDGDATNFDYFAGSAAVVAHEYQHAVTDFCFEDAVGLPGVPYGGWIAAMHEGLSDVFGTLYEADWKQAADVSHRGQIYRNAVFPPDATAFSKDKLDHWDDRNDPFRSDHYARGTILAHCAYLMGSGGVHQRRFRSPELIPVYDLGAETVRGRSVLRAARIWYRALHKYFGTVAAPTGDPSNDATLFRRLREACLSAASDLYATTLPWVQKNTELAFYAVGLQPPGEPYGADCTFLPWAAAWRRSRPFVGITSPTWGSVDLFINNDGTSNWFAQVHISDPDFENKVYCRVRNVGDLDATDVTVFFDYATIGGASTGWLPVLDKNGAAQQLSLGTLGAGSMTFPDSQQNSPPATAMVKWRIPPIPAGERVDEYVLRARVFATNDVNNFNNEVRSNIAYGIYGAIVWIPPIDFRVRNPT